MSIASQNRKHTQNPQQQPQTNNNKQTQTPNKQTDGCLLPLECYSACEWNTYAKQFFKQSQEYYTRYFTSSSYLQLCTIPHF